MKSVTLKFTWTIFHLPPKGTSVHENYLPLFNWLTKLLTNVATESFQVLAAHEYLITLLLRFALYDFIM